MDSINTKTNTTHIGDNVGTALTQTTCVFLVTKHKANSGQKHGTDLRTVVLLSTATTVTAASDLTEICFKHSNGKEKQEDYYATFAQYDYPNVVVF